MSQIECPYDQALQEDLEKIAALPIAWDLLNNSTVLIAGATGLIGSQLVRAILAENRIRNSQIQILAMVRSSERPSHILGNLMHRPELNILTGDIMEPISTDQEIDYFIHIASVTASKEFVTHPVDVIEVPVGGTKNILDLAREKHSKSVVFLSSMEVYGTIPTFGAHRITEGELGYFDLSNVRSCYPESKRLCENPCIFYAAQYGGTVKIEVETMYRRLIASFEAQENENAILMQGNF